MPTDTFVLSIVYTLGVYYIGVTFIMDVYERRQSVRTILQGSKQVPCENFCALNLGHVV